MTAGLDPYRLRRLRNLFDRMGRLSELDAAVETVRRDSSVTPDGYLEALYVGWFGPIRHRYDRGQTRGPQSWRHEALCLGCLSTFPTSRPDAKTCSPRCRKRWQRMKDCYVTDESGPRR